MFPARILRLLAVASLTAVLAGCISIYRMDIGQGNIVTPEMKEQLRLGMTRSQVRFVLGTPLVTDTFHPDRWDYYYSLSKGGAKAETRHLTVVFKDDALVSIDDDGTAKP